MAVFARKGRDSDITVYNGFYDFVCEYCAFRTHSRIDKHVHKGNAGEMIKHVADHEYVGHVVPRDLRERLAGG